MIRHQAYRASVLFAACLGLIGCGAGTAPQPDGADLSAEIVLGDKPIVPEGACWADDETPAVIETVTEQIAEVATPDRDAGFRTETSQSIVQPRQQIWFQTPCDAALTPDVIATLQRALAARGVFSADATGVLDPATRDAIRAYQSARGLKSDRLSLAAARDLGVIAADFSRPK